MTHHGEGGRVGEASKPAADPKRRGRAARDGHGMSENREPKGEAGLPHGSPADAAQPYAHEIQDYTNGVARPPDERAGDGRKGRP